MIELEISFIFFFCFFYDDYHVHSQTIRSTFVIVKKFFAISFFFIYLFSTTELHQLLKLPMLFEHYTEHLEENKQITLWQFFYIHYAMDHGKDADHGKDMKLPFKSHDNCVTGISNVYVPLFQNNSILKPSQFLEKKTFKNKDHFLLTSFLSNIWQPPKVHLFFS